MPIIFRCPNCSQKLSVTSRKSGQEVTCPECVHRVLVPTVDSKRAVEEAAPPAAEVKAHATAERNAWLEDAQDEEKPQKRPFINDELDMTPMVDVTFLLLIFFMITASFAVQKSLQTTPPEPESEGVSQNVSQEDVEEESVIVDIDQENNIMVDDVPVSNVAELVDILVGKRSGENKKDVLIEVHELAKHGTVVAVTDAALDADMQHIRRMTRKGEE